MPKERLIDLLLKDEIIQNKYKIIQEVDTTSYYHGFQHISNVIKILEKFIELFNIDEQNAEKLKIAILFHDIGREETGKNHELKSAEFMKKHLNTKYDISKFGFTKNDLDEIYEAIRLHEQKENLENLTFFQLLVNFVDKLDVTKERVNLNNPLNPELPSYKYDILREIYLDVYEVNIIIEDTNFIIEFEGNENLTLERLYSIPFMQRVDKLHKEFSKRNGLNAKVRIKNQDYNLKKRK